MKYNCIFLLPLVLLSTAGAWIPYGKDVINNGYNPSFLELVAKFNEDSTLLYSNVRKALEDLKINSEKTDFAGQRAQIAVALNEASDLYLKIRPIFVESCSYTKAVYSYLVYLPKLTTIRPEVFSQTSKQLIEVQAQHLKYVVDDTIYKTDVANGYMNQLVGKLTNVSGIVGHINASLDALKTDRIKSLVNEAFSDLDDEASIQILESVVKYTRATKDYVDRIVRTPVTLKNYLTSYGYIIEELKKAAAVGQEVLKNLPLSGEMLSKLNRNQIISISDKITRAVGGVYEYCRLNVIREDA